MSLFNMTERDLFGVAAVGVGTGDNGHPVSSTFVANALAYVYLIGAGVVFFSLFVLVYQHGSKSKCCKRATATRLWGGYGEVWRYEEGVAGEEEEDEFADDLSDGEAHELAFV